MLGADKTLGQASDGLLFAIQEVLDGRPLGLAVSGGSDSMALLHMVGAYAKGQRVEVVTVDHRLRPEAAAEALYVKSIAQAYGFAHETLVWADHPDSGNIMQAGSKARYDLMADWAMARGIGRIALAHSADDQAESFLMGLSRGAGLDGLCGMRPRFAHKGVDYLRPLLAVTRQDLRDFLTAKGFDWRDDPSNANPDYTRVRMRALVGQMAHAGISLTAINRSVLNLVQLQPLVQQSLQAAYQRCAQEADGALYLDPQAFGAELPEMRRRLIVAAVRWFSGRRYPARSEQIAQMLAQIERGGDCTLGGMRLRHLPKGLRLSREERAISPPSQGPIWDHRWRLEAPLGPDMVIRALGAEGMAQLKHHLNRDHFGRLNGQLLRVSPSLWQKDRLLAAPLAAFNAETWPVWPISFQAFLLSH